MLQKKFRMMEKVHLLANYTDDRTLTSMREGALLRTTGRNGIYRTRDRLGIKSGPGTEIFDPTFGTRMFVPTTLLAYPGGGERLIEETLLHRFPPQTTVELTNYYLEWGSAIGLPRGTKGQTTGGIGTYNMKMNFSVKSSHGVEIIVENIGRICVPPDFIRKIKEDLK